MKAGDIDIGPCYTCKTFVTITYKIRDVPLSDDSGIVRNVLVGVCASCDSVCVLPTQSTPTIREALKGR